MKSEQERSPSQPNWNGGVNHPRDHNGSLLPSPWQVEREKILKATIAREEAMRNEPIKSVNTIIRERFQDEANARAVEIQRSSWLAR